MAQSTEHPAPSTSTPRRTAAAAAPAASSVAPELGYRREIIVPPSPPLPTPVPKNQTVVCVCNESVRTVVVPPTDTLAPSSSSSSSGERGPRAPRSGPSHRTEENRHASSPGSPTAGPQLQCTPSRPTEASRHPLARTGSQLHPDAATPSATSPNHYSPSPPSANSPSPCSPHQNIDWRNYTTYKEYIDNKRLYMYGCRTIQERLDSLRAAATAVSRGNGGSAAQQSQSANASSPAALASQVRRRSTSHDRAYASPRVMTPLRSVSQERLLGPLSERGLYRDWARSASQDALPSSTPPGGAAKPRARSCDYLGRQGGGEGLAARLVEMDEQHHLVMRGDEARASRLCGGAGRGGSQPLRNTAGGGSGAAFADLSTAPRAESLGSSLAGPGSTRGGRPSRLPVKAASLDASASSAASYVASALASIQSHLSSSTGATAAYQEPIKDQRPVTVGNHLPHTSIPQHLHPRGRAESFKELGSREVGSAVRSASCSAPSKSPALRTLQQAAATNNSASSPAAVTSNGTSTPQLRAQLSQERANDGAAVEGADAKVVVVMRREKPGPQPIRHPSYILAVNDTDASPGSPGAGADSGGVCWLPNDARREVHMRRLGEHHHTSIPSNLGDSLDSIPFIGES